MPKFLENKLKAEYGANSKIPYKVMNKLGVMRGNKETAKGVAMDEKHAKMQADMSAYKGKQTNFRNARPVRKVMNRYK